MSGAGTRVGVGTRFRYDGETVEVVEMAATTAGNEVVLKDGRGRLLRLSLKELLFSDRAAVIPEQAGPAADDAEDIASVVLGQLHEDERRKILDRAEHVREANFRSFSFVLAAPHCIARWSSGCWRHADGDTSCGADLRRRSSRTFGSSPGPDATGSSMVSCSTNFERWSWTAGHLANSMTHSPDGNRRRPVLGSSTFSGVANWSPT
ncbi:hypothetical protein ACFY9S_07000 [Streptomyces sp. NPDC012474]|uniref:hypothetical protein n=1 Tax=Streptomyces sp. NPDC012474 TaxID=3364836 RepID=UPI0036E494C3